MRCTLACPTLGLLHTVAGTLIVLLGVVPNARAVNFEWDGGAGDNVWDTVILNPGVTTNWSPENVPISTDNIILTGASAPGPVTIDLDNVTRQVSRVEANGVDGAYTFDNGTLEIFLAIGNGVLSNDGGGEIILNSNVLFDAANILRFNVSTTGDKITANGSVSTSALSGTTNFMLTSRNLVLDRSVEVNGKITDGATAQMALTAGLDSDFANHRGTVAVTNDFNDYTGPTTVWAATLEFTSIGDVGETSALGAPANVADGTIAIAVDGRVSTLRYVGTDPVGHSSDRVIHINGSNSQAKIEASGAGPLTLAGTTTTDSFTTNRTLHLAGDNTDDNTYSGVITPATGSGAQQLLKSGNGKWILTAANTYEGLTSVLDGELVLQGASARIGVQNGSVGAFDIASGATFTLDGGSVEALDLNNSGTLNFRSGQMTLVSNNTTTGAGSFTIGTNGAGTLRLNGGSQIFGNVTLQGADDTLSIAAGGTYQFTNLDNSAGGTAVAGSGQNVQINGGVFTHRVDSGTIGFLARIQGTGGFTKQGAGTVVFSGTNSHTYTGDTRIEGGTLRVTTSDLPTVSTFIADGATLDLENATAGDEVGRLTGAGTVINTEFATFAVNFTGADGDFAGSITGLGNFTKRGAGKQILSGASTYTGATSVDSGGGTLEIGPNGSITGTSGVTYSSSGTLAVAGGTIDTPGDIRPVSNSGVFNITAGLVKANHIDRTVNTAYLSPLNWTGGTVHLLTATTINGSTITAANRPFAGSLTLDGDMALIIDSTFSVTGGTFNINGGSVTADTIVTGGNINFNSGTMRMRNSQTFDTARLNALGANSPLVSGKSMIVDATATINAPIALAGGSFSAGTIVDPENLVLGSGTLNVTNSDLAIAAATAVDVSSGMTVNVTSGALDNAGDLNVIGGEANFSAASTNQADAEINAINATLTFTGGLTNNGDVNLINSTVNGSLVNGAGSNSTLLGSNSFSNDLVLAGGDTILIDIDGGLPGEFDVVSVGGDATLDGLLAVSLKGGFTPTPGQQFTVLTAGNVTDNGLVLGGAAASSFNLLVGSTSVILQAVGAGLPGDYNQNGIVDAADYTVWRDGLGSTYTQADYDVWKDHFGQTAGSGAGRGATAAVPEPSALVLFAGALLALGLLRRNGGWRSASDELAGAVLE